MSTIEIGVTAQQPEKGNSTWKDWLGIVASVGCAIHCAAMPFVIAYLPALGLSFLADEAFHKWMALVCFLIALIAFVPGLRKHGNWIPVATGVIGLALITFAAFGLSGECCASCNGSKATATAEADGEASCCDECEHCESESEDPKKESESLESATAAIRESSIETPPTQDQNEFLTMFAPWITPIGGVLLVAAHLLNRRYGSTCGCCEAQSETEPELKTI